MPLPSRTKSLGTGAVFLFALAFLGVILGGFVATRIFYTSSMGWDQMADAVGGAFAGLIVALIVGALVVGRIANRTRLMGVGIALAIAAVAVVYMRATPANIRPPSELAIQPPLVEPFSLQFGTKDPLEGPRHNTDDLPWKTLRISSNLSFDYIPHDTPDTLCMAPGALASDDGIAALKGMREILANLPNNLDCSPCPTCTEIDLVWFLGQERSTLSAHERCWRENEALQPLRKSIEGIVTRYADTVACEKNR